MATRAPILPQSPPISGEVHINSEWCKGCELCIEYCPTKVLVLSSEFNAKGYHFPLVANDKCIACQSCFVICPEFAIFATESSVSETPEAVLSA